MGQSALALERNSKDWTAVHFYRSSLRMHCLPTSAGRHRKMSTGRNKKPPAKPDRYLRGGIYWVNLPTQNIGEVTDGKQRMRPGVEQAGAHLCIVLSSNQVFNDTQNRGLVVIPTTSEFKSDGTRRFEVIQPYWVRLEIKGDGALALCEQVRYVDRGRCGQYAAGLLLDSSEWAEIAEKVSMVLGLK